MRKELLKKLQLGIISFSAFALLAACGDGMIDEPTVDDDPAVETPADEDVEEEEPAGGVSEEEEQDN